MANTGLEHFSFSQFKAVMSVSDIDEPTYALILRAIFAQLQVQYEISIEASTSITSDMVFAIYRHAKFLFEVHNGNLDVLESVSDSSGNKTKYKVKVPIDIASTYKMYSPVAPALL